MSERTVITKRQYNILEILEVTIGDISLHEIGEHLCYSYRTIQQEITLLKERLPPGWFIESKRGVGISLDKPLNQIVASAFNHNGDQSLFNLIEILLTDRSYSLNTLCEKIFFSKSAVLKSLNEVEDYIKSFNLTLERNPFLIAGNEGFKRLLLYEIYYTKNGIYNRYAFSPPCDQLLPAEAMLRRHYHIRLTNYGFQSFCRCFYICKTRMEQGYPANELPFNTTEKVQAEPLFIEFKSFFDYLETLTDSKFPLQERIYLYVCLIHHESTLTIAENEHHHFLAQDDYCKSVLYSSHHFSD
ncbi:helix-turn-helix domain-containing protein [Lentibacillus kapialis]|uniref:helix-turn-helix domain-containing protein n=1 Tax=Lentibacillus kapialis TaxID=340214 RepID=UPI00166BE4F4|nr:helix-turn-helix domain-containing protein [Lentibacillus kapialis]